MLRQKAFSYLRVSGLGQLDGDGFRRQADAIERFAGSDPEAAKYYPEDAEFLLTFEPRVQHFELFGELGRLRKLDRFREIRRGLPRWW